MPKKKIIVCVTNDLVSDQRVHKVCMFLYNNNFDVELIGRILPGSLEVSRPYKTKRMRLLFKKGALFYVNYNLKLFFHLLTSKQDCILSNDLDTLLACYFASKLNKSELIYDSHEYFTEVPELLNRPKIKRIWEKIEAYIFPKIKTVYTVNDSLAKVYEAKYNVKIYSILNLPNYSEKVTENTNNELFTVIYQGALNKDRGLEELIMAFEKLEDVILWIVGEGDLSLELRTLTSSLNLNSKIKFWGKIPLEKLKSITQKAHLGVSLEKGTNLNYQFATPNKLFDYIASGLPVITSNLPEMKKIVLENKIGLIIDKVNHEIIANAIKSIKEDKKFYLNCKENTKEAFKILCWENQEETLKKIFNC